MSFSDLIVLIVPEGIVLATALVVLAVDLLEMRHKRNRLRMVVAALLAIAGCAVAMYWLGQADLSQRNSYFEGFLVVDPLVLGMKQLVLLLSVFTALVSVGTDFTDHVGEYFVLLLLATLGLMLLVSSENLLMLFAALELVSLSLCVMTAFNKRNVSSAEGALKYLLFSGISAAFLLFGLSWLYGATGELNLPKMAAKLTGAPLDPLVGAALVMVIVGLGFKIAVVPFHLWAPDVYQAAPASTVALAAAGLNVGTFFILAKVLMTGFKGAEGSAAWRHFSTGWVPLLAIIAVLSMVVGNLAAVVQRRVRPLLAYSAIAHAGYMLVGLLPHTEQGFTALFYYAVTYALTMVGALGVVALVEQSPGGDQLTTFAGLIRRAPLLSICLMVFLLSLAGIPPLAGYFGRSQLFASTLGGTGNQGLRWLVIVAIGISVVALFYYLKVLWRVFLSKPPSGAPPVVSSFLARLAIVVLAVAVVALGYRPGLLLETLQPLMKLVGP